MQLPGDLLERPAGESARLVVLALLSQAEEAAQRLGDPSDEEALHDFRVAIRRTRAALESWADRLPKKAKKLRRELTRIQRSTGAARDAEVALEWLANERAGAEPEIGERSEQRAERADTGGPALPARDPRIVRAIDWLSAILDRDRDAAIEVVTLRDRFEEVRAELVGRVRMMEYDLLADSAGATFAEEVASRARARFEALFELLSDVGGAEDADRMHQARIEGKGLRYLVEPLEDGEPLASEVVRRLKKLQDLLGDLHDAHVLADRIEVLRVDAGDFTLRTAIDSLRSRVIERSVALHRRLVEEWLERGLDALRTDVEQLAGALAMHRSVEVERKYLLSGMPDLPGGAEAVEIDQGYLPGRRLRERVRRVVREGSVQYYRTIKLGMGVERMEIEEETTLEIFDALWSLTEGCRIRKRRYLVEHGDLTWEIDQFLDRDLVLAEVELPAASVKPPIPPWLSPRVLEDVTERAEYTNLSLAR